MIAFASLLLGLVVGPEPVELLVGDAVAAVEIRLGGESVGKLRGEPWSLVCDFGAELRPQELVAIAYDRDRKEVGRVRQWVNLPRRPAEATMMLAGGREGRGVIASLSWESVVSAEPSEIMITFDGRPVAVRDPQRILLPDHDPEKLHLLRAELDFSRNVSTVLEMILGGTYTDQLDVELTAVPVGLARGSKLPQLGELQGALTRGGRPLTVVAAEEGPVEVVVVRDEKVRRVLNRIGRTSEKALRRHARVGLKSTEARSLRYRMSLPREHRVRFLWPFVKHHDDGLRQKVSPDDGSQVGVSGGGVDFDVLSPSQTFTSRDGGFYWLLTEYSPPVHVSQEQRLGDAVAIAGLLAASRNRRRAVILITRAGTADSSVFTAEEVRGYLRRLRVPLFVWTPEEVTTRLVERWGPVADVSSLNKLEEAVKNLKRRLERQRIVWVYGVHPPGDVALAGHDGIRLVQ